MIIKPLISFVICLLVSTLINILLGPNLSVMSGNVMPVFQVLVTVLAALSLAFFTYTDNIEQKLSELYKKFQESKIDQAHKSIASLKKELLANIFFAFGILIIERVLNGLPAEKYIFSIGDLSVEASLIVLVLRVALFLLALIVFIDQARAFITSIQFRYLVSKGAGKQ